MGSIFRTADAVGIEKIYLCGYTPAPLDRFGTARKDFAKVSLGAEKTVPWEQSNSIARAIELVKSEGCYVVAIEQDKNSTSLFQFKKPKKPLALVLGNEVHGLSKPSLKLCDVILEIPMQGYKESLNVSVAAGVALFLLGHK